MIVIGERISIIAKKVRDAMMSRDKKPLQELALVQMKTGANYLDLSIGPAEEGGEELMDWGSKNASGGCQSAIMH